MTGLQGIKLITLTELCGLAQESTRQAQDHLANLSTRMERELAEARAETASWKAEALTLRAEVETLRDELENGMRGSVSGWHFISLEFSNGLR